MLLFDREKRIAFEQILVANLGKETTKSKNVKLYNEKLALKD